MNARQGPIQIPVGPLVGAIGGLLLLVSLFLDWYEGLTGFTVFEFVDVVLVLCSVLIMVQLAGGMGLIKPPVSPTVSLLVSLFAIVVVLTQVLNDPPAVAGGNGPGHDVGIWLAVGGATLMVAGAVLATAHISLAVEPREHAAEGDVVEPPPERFATSKRAARRRAAADERQAERSGAPEAATERVRPGEAGGEPASDAPERP